VNPQRCLELALNALSRGDLDGAAGWCRAVIIALDRTRTPPPRTLHDIARGHRPIAVWAGLRPVESDPRD
jgi:hypothetical protein